MDNPICKLFNIKYPLIQAGMIWCSGWELASAVSNAGGLGLIGSGSMYPIRTFFAVMSGMPSIVFVGVLPR